MRVDEHTIILDRSPIFYRSAGEQEAPPLYLHGIPTSSDDWVDFLAQTGGIAPDLIGFGRSGKGEFLDHSLAGIAEFVARFLDVVGVDAVQLIAHDWGVAVGMAFAHRHPARVTRFVLSNAPPLIEGFDWPRLMRLWRTPVIGEAVMGASTRGLLARTLRHGCVKPDAWTDARIAAVWDQFDQGTQRAILRLVRSVDENMLGSAGAGGPGPGGPEPTGGAGGPGGREPTGDAGRRERAGEAGTPEGASDSMPALVLWGERDPWYPTTLGEAFAARLPAARFERIADAGHWPWLDRADVIERVAMFLH